MNAEEQFGTAIMDRLFGPPAEPEPEPDYGPGDLDGGARPVWTVMDPGASFGAAVRRALDLGGNL